MMALLSKSYAAPSTFAGNQLVQKASVGSARSGLFSDSLFRNANAELRVTAFSSAERSIRTINVRAETKGVGLGRKGKYQGGQWLSATTRHIRIFIHPEMDQSQHLAFASSASTSSSAAPLPLPPPPAGFVLNDRGEVIMMAPEDKRTLTIVEPETGRPLDCVVRRTFLSSQGAQFFLLLPLDVPILILRVAQGDGSLEEVDESQIQEVFPPASYELAKKSLHLVLSGYSLTARGAICYSPDDVIDIDTEYGLGIGSNLSEGVELGSFSKNGDEYIIYTPFDPLMFIAYRNDQGDILIVEDSDLLDDPKVLDAIDEEQEFQQMVDDEDAVKAALQEASK